MDSNWSGEETSEVGTSPASSEDSVPPVRTMPSSRASACAPTTLPGPMAKRPLPESVVNITLPCMESVPVRSRGPVTA